MTQPESKAPSVSATEMTEILLPQHANALGTAFGGTIMSWIDVCAAVAAQRHCGRIAVTAFVDDMQFLRPIRVGDVVRLTAVVNATFRTSLEVGVLVERESRDTMERVGCVEAFLTFVNLDDNGRPSPVPKLAISSDEERAREADALARRERRLAR